MKRFWFGFSLLLSILLLGLMATAVASNGENPESTPYNIVLFYTDDQRWDTLCWAGSGLTYICNLPPEDRPMPFLEGLMAESVVFSNAYVTQPICCPARSSLLSGGYFPHDTNVLSNKAPTGGATQFSDTVTIATLLQEQGYATALIGKYFNQYVALVDKTAGTGYVPPGWTLFQSTYNEFDWFKNDDVVGSSTHSAPGVGLIVNYVGKYLTDHHRDVGLEFLDTYGTSQPFFLMLSLKAPHYPAVPPPGYESWYDDFSYRERGWWEFDFSDKPHYIAVSNRIEPDEAHQDMLRSLRGVDKAVADIVNWLQQNGQWENTIFVFTSDHGYMWGEHHYYGKAVPYEESLRVPFIIRYPGALPHTETRLVTGDRDLSATILEAAGIPGTYGEGTSLIPLILDPGITWRDHLFHEGFDPSGRVAPSWVTLRRDDEQGGQWKYTEYASGETELYDLVNDPFEFMSVSGLPAYADIESSMAAQMATFDRGVAITSQNLNPPYQFKLPKATVGQPYTHTFEAWGGDGNYIWSMDFNSGGCNPSLPPGMTLDPVGLLTGTPELGGFYRLCLVVKDTSVSPQPGNSRPQSHWMPFILKVLNN